MDREDAVAVEWMSEFERDPYPKKIVWHVKDKDQKHFYWLTLSVAEPGLEVSVFREGQTITFLDQKAGGVFLRFNDKMVDLNQPLTVNSANGFTAAYNRKVSRTIKTLYKTMLERGDKNYMFPAELYTHLMVD